jgi:hypothetical protein
MLPKIGQVVTNREIAARWSYSEITGRFASLYAAAHTDSDSVKLIAKILDGASFDDIDDGERELLRRWFDTGLRRDFSWALNEWYDSFRCESWTKSQLARVHTLPVVDPLGSDRQLAFLSYLAHPRRRLPNGDPEVRDPAVAADGVPLNEPFVQREPLVIGHWMDGKLTLWEGNFRAVLFARSVDPRAEVLVWMPNEGKWPGK